MELCKKCYIIRKRKKWTQKDVCTKYNIRKHIYQMFEVGMLIPEKINKNIFKFYEENKHEFDCLEPKEELDLWCHYVAETLLKAADRLNIGRSTLQGIIRGRTTSNETKLKIFKKTGIRLD